MEVGLAVGCAFLSSALNVFFDRMTPKFPSLFRGHNGADQLFKKLKRTLRVLEAVLDDAEDKQITNRNVNEWLCELKDTVYHAEDLVDEINTEVLRLEVEGGEQSVTDTVSQLSDEFLKEIIPKIEKVVTTLEDFVSRINVLGLERGAVKKDNSYRLPSTCLVDESEVYGRSSEREKLVQMVLSDNGNNVGVIPIVGMGGSGKTTLAQVVYGDERVEEHFDTRAWVCVSENYDLVKITKTLVGEITHSNFEDKSELNMLQVTLKESLVEKKFLIVLDDIWNDNYNDWDKLKAPLKYGKQGSKIIMTSRNEKVALMMGNEPIHYLEPILDDDCWSLFKKHAFDNDGPRASLEFEKIGKEIVKKCNGLPLAVKTLAGLLRSKREIKEWGHILKSEFWTSENNSNDVLPVLRLSYHHLPSHLKHCFAFCAMFPKNHHFNEKELVLLWMANDLLQHQSQNDRTIEDLGCEYLSELRSRSFFQKVSDDKYSMHDLVNDLARYVCGKFCVRLEDYPHGEIPIEVRHFSYMSEYFNAFEKFKFLPQVKNLRTFFPTNLGWIQEKLTKIFLSDILPRLGRLRVLSLCNYDIKQLPNSICKLKHLRNVNFSHTNIEQLPDAICNLYNLQTLLLIRCRNLRKLPMNFTKLVNLRHLDLSGTVLSEMPSHMSKLKFLQTLSYFIVGSSPGSGIEELGKLDLHGYLKIMGLQNVINGNDAHKANLRNKKHLEDLVLEWSGDIDDSHIAKDIFDKLQPHTNLKSLTIDGYGGTIFADWLTNDSFCNIVSLCLTNCKNCFSLPALGHLESLKSLSIKSLDMIVKIGEEFYGDVMKPFESLVTLRIEQMLEWEEWDTSGNVKFFGLENLYLKNCPKLKGQLPSQLLCLKTLEIYRCSKVVFPDNWMTISQDNQVGLRSHMSSLRISNMPLLEELPEGLLKLGVEELSVTNCHNLISSSPRAMTHVNKMFLYNCPSLVSLPIVGPSANIKELEIWNCTKFEFPTTGENSDGWCISIEYLRVDKAGDSLNDTSLGLFSKLQTLELSNCESLKMFPAPPGIQTLTFLRRLKINSCDNLLSFPKGGLQAPNLDYFHVEHCQKLKSLPEQMHYLLPLLRHLYLYDCPEIECFPEGGLPSSLEYLRIKSCKKLMRCPRDWGLQKLPALRELIICDYDEYEEESFPDEWLLPSSLRALSIVSNKKLKTLNDKGLLRLTSLQTLQIYYCPEVLSLPEKGLPTSLQTLEIYNCHNLVSLPKEGLPTSLQTLQIENCLVLLSLPEKGLPTSLQTLYIYNCPNFVSLPKAGLPSSLQTLKIWGCPKLESLPEEGLPTSLSKLQVKQCPILKPHLERERGKYWPNIAHIPFIDVDEELIS